MSAIAFIAIKESRIKIRISYTKIRSFYVNCLSKSNSDITLGDVRCSYNTEKNPGLNY